MSDRIIENVGVSSKFLSVDWHQYKNNSRELSEFMINILRNSRPDAWRDRALYSVNFVF